MPSFMVAVKVEDAEEAVAKLRASETIEPGLEAPMWPGFSDDDSGPLPCFVVAIAEAEDAAAASALTMGAIGNGSVAADARPLVPGSQNDAGKGAPHEPADERPAETY